MLIVPDIHGRSFWKETVARHFSAQPDDAPEEERKVVFLGDYLDPYPRERISMFKAMDVLRDVIELKRMHPDDVVLLLGNHDMSYIMPGRFRCSRHDYFYEQDANKLFWDNIDMFSFVHTCCIRDKRYIFSHAGITPGWSISGLAIKNMDDVISICSQGLSSQELIDALRFVSLKRGGRNVYGSMIWADLSEFDDYSPHSANDYQVFGHTQQSDTPIVTQHYACLDCRKVFQLHDNEFIPII